MADPLSISASAITVCATGIACARSILDIIQEIRDAPEDLIALSNEVNDLSCIVDEAGKVCRSLAVDSQTTIRFTDTLRRLLQEAEGALGELNGIVLKYKSKKRTLDQTVLWLRQKSRTKRHLMKLQGIRMGILELLTSATALVQLYFDSSQLPANIEFSHRTLHIDMRMQEIQSTLDQLSQQLDSTPATIVRELLLQRVSLKTLHTDNPVNPSKAHCSLRTDHSKEQNWPIERPDRVFGNEANASPSLLESNNILPEHGRVYGITSGVLIN